MNILKEKSLRLSLFEFLIGGGSKTIYLFSFGLLQQQKKKEYRQE